MEKYIPDINEFILYEPKYGQYLYYSKPEKILTADEVGNVRAVLSEVEDQVQIEGYHAAGFLTYEAAPAFDPAFRTFSQNATGLPLAWFGLYKSPEQRPTLGAGEDRDYQTDAWVPDISQEDYKRSIGQIKEYIARGDTYQVNFTYRLCTPWDIPAFSLFQALNAAHPAPYGAYLETENWAICSFSPELFFRLEGERLTNRPMKGTAPRGLTLDEDKRLAAWLQNSEKNRAENVMIVDMVRNDMGRIARVGSVQVPEIFAIERYPTVLQMTSTVQAETRAGLEQIFAALYPCASITGAPKIRTMEIINQLESSPRGIYTGAIGTFAPGRKALFNVAIRTLVIDKVNQQAEYGVGGGIVWDSDPQEEWEETRIKARVVSQPLPQFELLETMRWTPEEGWFLLAEHLQRLADSAEYFDFKIDAEVLQTRLAHLERTFGETAQRVRLKLSRSGRVSLEAQPNLEQGGPKEVGIAKIPIHSSDRFLYHKTTFRESYRQVLAATPGFKEVLLWNERGELTEGTIANLVVEIEGEWFTPPVSSGLLAGTFRARLLEQGQVKERILRLADLPKFEKFFLVNSVRGMWRVEPRGDIESVPAMQRHMENVS